MAGYAGTPLPKKLGIKSGHRVCLLNAPGNFARQFDGGDDVQIAHDLRLPLVDVVVLFVDRLVDFERRVVDIAARLHPAGRFWVAWRRNGKSRRGSDLDHDVVRRIAMACGLIDNKVSAIGDWVTVRLVMRGENRDAVAYRAEPPPLSRRVRRPTAPARMVYGRGGAGSAMRRARARSHK